MSHVLVIEDDSSLSDLLGRFLEHEGYRSVLASNGRDAWVTLYDELPSLIVLDLLMPEMDGLSFLMQLRDHHHWGRIPVLVLTGQGPDTVLVRRAKELGVSDVIHKGADSVSLLMKRVRQLLPAAKGQKSAVA